MKKIAISMVMMAVAVVSFGQNAIDKHFSDFESNEEFTKLNATSKMFEMTMGLESDDPDEQALLDALGKIEGLTLLAMEETEDAKSMFDDATSRPGNDYEILMTVDDKDGHAVFYVREARGVIAELLVIAHGNQEFGIATLWGEIDLKQVKKLTDAFSVAGMEKFDEVKAEAAREISVYPNPISQGKSVTVNVPNAIKGGTIEIRDMNGALVKSKDITASSHTLDTKELAPGTYLVVMNFDGASLYSERIVVTK